MSMLQRIINVYLFTGFLNQIQIFTEFQMWSATWISSEPDIYTNPSQEYLDSTQLTLPLTPVVQ